MSEWPSWAKVGAKCICVDDAPRPIATSRPVSMSLDGLTKGETYTIGSLDFDPLDRVPTIHLREIHRGENEAWGRPSGFRLARFRPAISLKQDVAAIKALVHQMGPTERLDFLADAMDADWERME